MPRKRNPYGYTIVENALLNNQHRWEPEPEEMELPLRIYKMNTKQRGEHYRIKHDDLMDVAANEARRVAGVSKEDAINAISAYRNVATSLVGNGISVDLMGMVDLYPNTGGNKRLTTKVKAWLLGLMRLAEERPDLPITPRNWYVQLFEHGSHIRKTPGWDYKRYDEERAAGVPHRRNARTYAEALSDLKTGAPVPPKELIRRQAEQKLNSHYNSH